jgi:hypothetical protein
LVLVVLAPPVARAARLAEPRPMLVVMMRMRRWCLCVRLAEPSPLLVAVMLARLPLAAGSNPVGWT